MHICRGLNLVRTSSFCCMRISAAASAASIACRRSSSTCSLRCSVCCMRAADLAADMRRSYSIRVSSCRQQHTGRHHSCSCLMHGRSQLRLACWENVTVFLTRDVTFARLTGVWQVARGWLCGALAVASGDLQTWVCPEPALPPASCALPPCASQQPHALHAASPRQLQHGGHDAQHPAAPTHTAQSHRVRPLHAC